MKVKRFELNTKGRDFVIGDLHGMYDAFQKMLIEIGFDQKIDRMFSVGDLVDRGKKSKLCLELMYHNWFHVCMANHEQMMINGLLHGNDNEYDSWLNNGGSVWMWEVDRQELKDLAKDFKDKSNMVMVVDTPKGRVNIVHAELFSNKDREAVSDEDIDNWHFTEENENMMVWGRTISEMKAFMPKVDERLSITYCGHTPAEKPFQCLSHRFIDTGAVFAETKNLNTLLTCVDLTNDVVYSLNCKTQEMTTQSVEQVFG